MTKQEFLEKWPPFPSQRGHLELKQDLEELWDAAYTAGINYAEDRDGDMWVERLNNY